MGSHTTTVSPTIRTTPSPSPTTPITRHKPKSGLNIGYINIGKSNPITGAVLEGFKTYDILTIGEPALHLNDFNNTWSCDPAWRRITTIERNTKVVGYVNNRVVRAKGSINRSGTVSVISLAMIKVVGVYLPGDAPLEDLIEDISNIPVNGRVVALADFNSHSVTWGVRSLIAHRAHPQPSTQQEKIHHSRLKVLQQIRGRQHTLHPLPLQ